MNENEVITYMVFVDLFGTIDSNDNYFYVMSNLVNDCGNFKLQA